MHGSLLRLSAVFQVVAMHGGSQMSAAFDSHHKLSMERHSGTGAATKSLNEWAAVVMIDLKRRQGPGEVFWKSLVAPVSSHEVRQEFHHVVQR